MYIEDCIEVLEDYDFIGIIKERLPASISNEEIKIVNTNIDNINFVNVAFYFEKTCDLPQIMYTHIYTTELIKYIASKL